MSWPWGEQGKSTWSHLSTPTPVCSVEEKTAIRRALIYGYQSSISETQSERVRVLQHLWLAVNGSWHGPADSDYSSGARKSDMKQNAAMLREEGSLHWHGTITSASEATSSLFRQHGGQKEPANSVIYAVSCSLSLSLSLTHSLWYTRVITELTRTVNAQLSFTWHFHWACIHPWNM